MILLLLGVVCFLAALRVARDDADGARDAVRGAGAAAWAGLVAVLVLGQLWAGRGALEGYRLTLLGFRYRVATEGEEPGPGLTVGGSYDSADLWVPGAGDRPVAVLRSRGAGTVEVVRSEDAGGVALVEEPSLLGTRWRVLGGRPVRAGDTVLVHGPEGTYRLVATTVPDTLRVAGAALPIPWVRLHALREAGAGDAAGGPPVLLPGVERGPLARLRPYHPSVFQRTYPLADVLDALALGGEAGLPALASFLYYRGGDLRLADLDTEVEVAPGAGSEAEMASARPGSGGEGTSGARTSGAPESDTLASGARLLVAGLPHRDYPEPDLTLPERYGVRPLRSFRIAVHGGWLDAGLTAPEVRSLDRGALEELRLPEGRSEDGRPVYRIRLASARDALARKAVVFDASPDRFAVPGQAVLTLPVDPSAGDLEVLTPSGLASWETGRPLALGTGERSLLLRADGQGTSAGYWLIHGALLLLPVLLFLFRPMTGPVFALALSAMTLLGFRLVLALSAMADPPHVMEAQQLALWLLPFIPWAVVVAGEVGRVAPGGGPSPGGRDGWRRWRFHGIYALLLVSLAFVLFPLSRTKAAALAVVALVTVGVRVGAEGGFPVVADPGRRAAALAARRPWLLRGWSLGLGLLLLRVLLDAAGWREQLTVGGTRIGVSLFYTPLVVVALAAVVARWGREIRRARDTGTIPRDVGRALLDLGAFVMLAYVGVGAWISDFGLALVLLPGALVLLALAGARWAPGGRAGALTVATLGLPLALFVLIQAAPPLLRFSWGGDLQAVDARLGEWNRNELLLLERGDPAGLRLIGQRRSEALAVMRETMRSYTRGNPLGKGFLRGRVSDEIAETSTREHAASALLASQFGFPGAAGLVLVLLSLVVPILGILRGDGAGGGRGDGSGEPARGPGAGAGLLALALAVLTVAAYLLPSPYNALLVGLAVAAGIGALTAPVFGGVGVWGSRGGPPGQDGGVGDPLPLRRWVAGAALLTVALAGLYMVLANYGLAFFTGKNVYLLGLDSVGDGLESAALLALAAGSLGLEARGEAWSRDGGGGEGTALETTGAVWWHPSDEGG